jgi:hypothetical protein
MGYCGGIRLKAYQIAMAIILFQFAIGLANAMGFYGGMTGITTGGLITTALTSIEGIAAISVTIIGFFLATRVGGLHVPLGAAVFAATFTVTSIPLEGLLITLNTHYTDFFPGALQLFIITPLYVVILYGFIQLSSQGTKGSAY